jgi:hypothetical protein
MVWYELRAHKFEELVLMKYYNLFFICYENENKHKFLNISLFSFLAIIQRLELSNNKIIKYCNKES